MTVELSKKEAFAVFALIFEGVGGLKQHGITMACARRLEKLRLIEAVPNGTRRPTRWAVTDEAWDWAAAHLDAAFDAGSKSAARTLGAVLRLLGKHLAAHNFVLTEFVPAVLHDVSAAPTHARQTRRDAGPSRAPRRDGTPGKSVKRPRALQTDRAAARRKRDKAALTSENGAVSEARHRRGTARKSVAKRQARAARAERSSSRKRIEPSKPATSTRKKTGVATHGPIAVTATRPSNSNTGNTNGSWSGSVASRVHDVALSLAGGVYKRRVRLRDVRLELADVPRRQLDEVLLSMQEADALVLYKIDDPTDVAAEDEAAALRIAGEPRHILYLVSRGALA